MNRPSALRGRESLYGTFFLLEEPEKDRAIKFDLDLQIAEWLEFAVQRRCAVTGRVTAEGVAENAVVRGFVRFDLLRERRLPDELTFFADSGREIRLIGQKEWVPAAPVESFFTMNARLFDREGAEFGRAYLLPDSRHPLWSLLGSLRAGRPQ